MNIRKWLISLATITFPSFIGYFISQCLREMQLPVWFFWTLYAVIRFFKSRLTIPKYITVNHRVEEKIESMRRFKQYSFKKTYLSDSIFVDKDEETKIGYFNMQGFMESNHAKYVDCDPNLLSLNFLVCSETWLT